MSDASHNIPYDIEAPVPILFFEQNATKPRPAAEAIAV